MIRQGEPRDEEILLRLRVALWPDDDPAEGREMVQMLLAGKPPGLLPAAVFVAEVEGDLAGFVEVSLRSFVDGCAPDLPVGFVEGWYVSPEHRGRAVGRSLIEAARVWALKQGCRELGSDTLADNMIAQRAHEALGFEEVDHCVNYRQTIQPVPEAGDPSYYGADLAAIHHAHFGQVAADAAAELLARLLAAGVHRGLVIDLASGSGILSRRVVEAGFQAFGVDLSAAMVRKARTAVPEATFVRGSLWDAKLPGVPEGAVAIAVVGEAFCYATDPTVGLAGLRRRLEDLHRALAPGGLLLFDVAGPGRSGGTGSRERCIDLGETLLRLAEHEDSKSRTLTRDITLFLPLGRLYRRTFESHRLALYEPEQIETMLAEVGFSWDRLAGYRETAFPPGWFGFVACKQE